MTMPMPTISNVPRGTIQPRHKQTPKQAAYLFFLKHAGYSVKLGESQRSGHSRSARQLAAAERDACALGYRFEWYDDDHFGNHSNEADAPEHCELCVCYDDHGHVVDSLGCIDDATPEYRRVVEAELAMEALAEQR